MSDDLTKLKELAKAATPGPWSVFNYDCGDCEWYDHNGPCPSIQAPEDQDCAIVHWDGFKQQYWSSANGDQRKIEANAAFIAAANPATMLSLIARIEELEKKNKQLKDSMEPFISYAEKATPFTCDTTWPDYCIATGYIGPITWGDIRRAVEAKEK